jgi:hypothetical protein
MTDVNRIVLTDKVELLDNLILYRRVKGTLQGIKDNDLVELGIDLEHETKRGLYQVKSISYKRNRFIAQLLLIQVLD